MGRSDAFEIAGHRDHHVGNVIALRRPEVNPRHPSVTSPGVFDQDDPDVAAADRCVLLTKLEAQLIASLLKCARGHLPSPKAADEAITLLVGDRAGRAVGR